MAVLVVVAMTVTPLTALGATVMTVDPLSVLFWTAAMIAGWRAAQPDGTTREWLWVGLWMGLGFLSKYTNLAQCVCWAVFFLLWPPARGPSCAAPARIWRLLIIGVSRHCRSSSGTRNTTGSPSATSPATGRLGEAWHRTYVVEFLLTETALLHPLFFVAGLGGGGVSGGGAGGIRLSLYFFSMGAPLFLGYFILSLHSRILGNWIAPVDHPAVLPCGTLLVETMGRRACAF